MKLPNAALMTQDLDIEPDQQIAGEGSPGIVDLGSVIELTGTSNHGGNRDGGTESGWNYSYY